MKFLLFGTSLSYRFASLFLINSNEWLRVFRGTIWRHFCSPCAKHCAKTCSPVISSHLVLPQCSERGTISPFTGEAPGLESWQRAQGYTASEGAGPGPRSRPRSKTGPAAASLRHLRCVCAEKTLKERHPAPSPAEVLNEEGEMQAEGAECVWLLEKVLGEFLWIHSRSHFRFLPSVPTSFSSAATTNSYEWRKKCSFLLLKKK